MKPLRTATEDAMVKAEREHLGYIVMLTFPRSIASTNLDLLNAFSANGFVSFRNADTIVFYPN